MGVLLMLILQEVGVYQEPFWKGLDSLAITLVKPTTYAPRQSDDEELFE